MSTLLHHSALVFGRAAREARRQSAVVFVAPAMLSVSIVLLFDGLYGQIATTSAYPGEFIEWVAPAAVLLSVFIGAGYTAISLIRDARSGYAERLDLLSVSPAATILGRVAFDAVRAVPPAAAVLGVCVLLGATNENGLGGTVGVLALCSVLAVAWNGIFYAAAVLTLNPSVIQALQPATFMPAVMFSSFWVPAALMPEWYRWIADHNPVTPTIDAARSIMLGNTDWAAVRTSAAVLLGLAALTYLLVARRISTKPL
jgi:ABC-2 type transport system permease protein